VTDKEDRFTRLWRVKVEAQAEKKKKMNRITDYSKKAHI
jgi:hypothetical protein